MRQQHINGGVCVCVSVSPPSAAECPAISKFSAQTGKLQILCRLVLAQMSVNVSLLPPPACGAAIQLGARLASCCYYLQLKLKPNAKLRAVKAGWQTARLAN